MTGPVALPRLLAERGFQVERVTMPPLAAPTPLSPPVTSPKPAAPQPRR